MELLNPGIGLIFWQTITFLVLVFILGKFAWKPILKAVQDREKSIETAIRQAEDARKEMESVKADNNRLLTEARAQGEIILQEAKKNAEAYLAKEKAKAEEVAQRMMEDANRKLDAERTALRSEMKNMVAELSVDIAEKLLRQQLNDKAAQQKLVDSLLEDIKLN
jgi:F-type H+-transporting ATPase subunit b